MEEEVKKSFLIGIDDAGRGPVIGPMVLAGCILTPEVEQELVELGVADSKLLTKKKREALINVIKEKAIAHSARITTPAEIDTGMGIGLNLNQVEALDAALVIKDLLENSDIDKKDLRIIIDCPSVNTVSWKENLVEYLDEENKTLDIICKHKADLEHGVVGAGSIIAKVTRDREIEKLKELIGVDFGSGYPADPKTKEFLKNNHDKYKEERIFRESWATFKNAKKAKDQMKLPDY